MVINDRAVSQVNSLLKTKTGYSLWGYIWRMLMLALAILCFIGGVKLFSFTNKISDYKDYIATSSMTESVTGKVISSERTDKESVFKSVIRYTVKGKDYEYIVKAFSTSRPEIGEEATVKYVPEDPAKAGINTPPDIVIVKNISFILSIALFILSAVFIIITIFIILRVINPKKKVDKAQNEPQYYAQQIPQNQQTNYQSQDSTYNNDKHNM